MKKIIINKKKGILFFITGLSGSGKSTIGKNIKKKIIEKYGPTFLIHGDDFRKIYNFKKYKKEERYNFGCQNTLLIKKILNQKINVIYTAVSLSHKSQEFKRKNIDNYVEIYIKSSLKKIIKFKKKKIYHNKTMNIIGIDIKPEFPKKPDVIICNDLKTSIKEISKKVLTKINQII